MNRRTFLQASAAAVLPLPEPAADKPNIVLILADDLGYGDLSCYGQKNFPTPHLDKLAAEGMRFTDFYSGSTVCAPSRCVLLTGLHTGHCFVRGNGKENLRPEDTTIAEVLKGAGYDTCHVGKWGLGGVGQTGFPLKKGFERFYGYLSHTHAHNYYPSYLWRNDKKEPLQNVVPDELPSGAGAATVLKDYAPDLFLREALTYLDQRKGVGKPFFLYYCPTIPHANNEAQRAVGRGMECPDDAYYTRFKEKDWPEPEKRKAAMISRLDAEVGQLLDRLRQNGLDKNTLVLFTSDNGPHQEGGQKPQFAGSSGPFKGIKRDLYEGGIRVPFIAWMPGRINAGKVINHVGYFADLMPTLTEWGGAKAPERTDGLSLLPTLIGKGKQAIHNHLYWEFYERGGARAVRMGKWKGVCQPWNAPLEVYDLTADPGETNNQAATQPEVSERLRALLSASHTPSPNWQLSPQPANPKRNNP